MLVSYVEPGCVVIHVIVVPRLPPQYKAHKLVYRRYAGLYFVFCVDVSDNELLYLESIHLFVEVRRGRVYRHARRGCCGTLRGEGEGERESGGWRPQPAHRRVVDGSALPCPS